MIWGACPFVAGVACDPTADSVAALSCCAAPRCLGGWRSASQAGTLQRADPCTVTAQRSDWLSYRSVRRCSTSSAHMSLHGADDPAAFPLQDFPRRAALGLVAGAAALLTGASPSLAAFGDSANVFGKPTNTSGTPAPARVLTNCLPRCPAPVFDACCDRVDAVLFAVFHYQPFADVLVLRKLTVLIEAPAATHPTSCHCRVHPIRG